MKFKVHVVRVAYRSTSVEVEASSPEEAKKKVEDIAGGLEYSSEYDCEYSFYVQPPDLTF